MRAVALVVALSSSLAHADDNTDNHVANLLDVSDGDALDHHVDAPAPAIDVNENVAIAPVVGASLSTLVVEESPGRFTELADKTLSVVGFAGLAGRFDLR
jgi:hypothetical protein